jgi:hypothetical protein
MAKKRPKAVIAVAGAGREVMYGVIAASKRARARGLSDDDIDREAEDDNSQFWEDFAEALRAYRNRQAPS